MDFFDRQDQARRKTVALVMVYSVVVVAICAMVYSNPLPYAMTAAAVLALLATGLCRRVRN